MVGKVGKFHQILYNGDKADENLPNFNILKEIKNILELKYLQVKL